jgi:hypothetical protein
MWIALEWEDIDECDNSFSLFGSGAIIFVIVVHSSMSWWGRSYVIDIALFIITRAYYDLKLPPSRRDALQKQQHATCVSSSRQWWFILHHALLFM